MRTLLEMWDRFWFQGGSARNLAAARLVFAGQGLWILLSRDYAGVSALPASMWAQVETTAQWRFLLFHGQFVWERGVEVLAAVALGAAIVGVFPRVACFTAAVCLYHLAPLESIVWTPNPGVRGLTITVLGLTVLSWSRCGDRLAWTPSRGSAPFDPALDGAWQIRLIQVFLAEVYLFSVVAKLTASGLGWIDGANVSRWLIYFNEQPDTGVFSGPGLWLAAIPTACTALALATVILEGGFVLTLVSDRIRRWWVPATVAFHLGILFLMNITFPALPLLLVFVNWDRVADRWG